MRAALNTGLARTFLSLCLAALSAFTLSAAEVIPPAPRAYFNDYASVIPKETASTLNGRLEEFERQTSSQIVVAVFPRMQSDSSIEDYTVRVAQAWRVGQQTKDNGAVLFVFIEDRAMYLQVGYGLEGALPDALAKRIIEDDIKPHFRRGDYAAGLTAGVEAVLAAVRGEYQGTGKTTAEANRGAIRNSVVPILIFVIILLMIIGRLAGMAPMYRRRGWHRHGGWTIGSSGGGWSSGGGFGGGFSGGGGGFGGGGAGGRW